MALTPSELLATLFAGIVDEVERDVGRVDHLAEVRRLLDDPAALDLPARVHLRPADEVGALGAMLAADGAHPLRGRARAVRLLDAWHEPLCYPLDGAPSLGGDHAAAEQLLFDLGRFNADGTGSLIPRQATVDNADADRDEAPAPPGDRGDLIAQLADLLLLYSLWLPPVMIAADPHTPDGPDRFEVRPRYSRAWASGDRLPPAADPVVAVAPVLEDDGDLEIKIDLTATPPRYAIIPKPPARRLKVIVDRAVADGAQLLLLPEMSLTADDLPGLKEMIADAREAYYAAHGRAPPLRYTIAGVAAACVPPSAAGHMNYAVMLDAEGSPINHMRQHKLSRWDLTLRHRQAYGLPRPPQPPLPSNLDGVWLQEDIASPDEVVVADLGTLGRLITLICADASNDRPWDELITIVTPDWMYMPIMDGSTCWQWNDKPYENWIIARAIRAARAAAGRAIVTNSMVWGAWRNAVNGAAGQRTFDRCGVALFVDGTAASPRYWHGLPTYAPPPDRVFVEDWRPAGWQCFPDPPAVAGRPGAPA